MKTSLFVMLILGMAAVVQAGVELSVTYSGSVNDPYTAEALDTYRVTVNATGPGEVISAVDIRFDAWMHQEMFYKSGFSSPHYTPTAMNDFAGWPAGYPEADSHFMLAPSDVAFLSPAFWYAGLDITPPLAEEDLDVAGAALDAFSVYHGRGTYLCSNIMGINGDGQAGTVELAQIVVPHGSDPDWVFVNGQIATNQMKDPYTLHFSVGGPQTSPFPGDTDHDGDADLADLGNLAGGYGLTSGATWEHGDFDGDGDIDLVDLGALAGNYRTIPSYWIPGDTNHDGEIDLNDLATIATHYGTTSGATWEMGDFDLDADVDLVDWGRVMTAYGLVVPAAPLAVDGVPEPAGVLLLMVGVLGLRRRTHRCPALPQRRAF